MFSFWGFRNFRFQFVTFPSPSFQSIYVSITYEQSAGFHEVNHYILKVLRLKSRLGTLYGTLDF